MAENKRIKQMVNWLISQGIVHSQQELGAICGITNKSYLSQLVNGHSFNREFINKFSEIDSRVNIDWLLTGEGEMLKSEAINIGTTGNINGNNNSGCVTVTQTIGDNSGQNAGRDINNPPCPNATLNMLNELKELRHLAEQQLQVYASSLDKKDEQIRAAHQHIDTLIRQNQEQFSRFMSLLEDSRHH